MEPLNTMLHLCRFICQPITLTVFFLLRFCLIHYQSHFLYSLPAIISTWINHVFFAQASGWRWPALPGGCPEDGDEYHLFVTLDGQRQSREVPLAEDGSDVFDLWPLVGADRAAAWCDKWVGLVHLGVEGSWGKGGLLRKLCWA